MSVHLAEHASLTATYAELEEGDQLKAQELSRLLTENEEAKGQIAELEGELRGRLPTTLSCRIPMSICQRCILTTFIFFVQSSERGTWRSSRC